MLGCVAASGSVPPLNESSRTMSRFLRASAWMHVVLLLAVSACAPPGSDSADADVDAEASEAEATPSGSAETTAHADGRPPSEGVSGGRESERETLVVVKALSVGPIRDEIVVSSKVESRLTVSVFPKLNGLPVTDVLVEEGEPVHEGDVLMTLFDVDLQLAAQTAQASADEAAKDVERQQLLMREEDARIKRAERLSQKSASDLARLLDLLADGFVNQQEVDDARLLAEQSADDLESARLAGEGARIAYELALIRRQKAEVESERARSDLTHATVRAPFTGVVSKRNVQIGELSTLSTPAFEVVDVEQLVLNLRVPQDALPRLARGQRVEVRAITNKDLRCAGVVRTVNPVLDTATGTVHVIVDLVPVPGLVPGIFSEARIVTGERDDALLVDKRAVMYDDDRPYFFAMDEGGETVRKVLFAHGASTATSIEILGAAGTSSGEADDATAALDASLRVVLVGQESLKDGARVRVREEPY